MMAKLSGYRNRLRTYRSRARSSLCCLRVLGVIKSRFTGSCNVTITMTIQTVNVSTLKRVKNNVIGNPSAKLSLSQDELFVATSVSCSFLVIALTLLLQPRQMPKRSGTIRGGCGIAGRCPC